LNPIDRTGLCRLGAEDSVHVRRFLRGDAAFNAYLLGQINRGALAMETIAGPFWGYYREERLEGVVCLGSNLVLSHPCSDEALEAFAQASRRGLYLVRVAIAEDETLQRFMEHYGRHFRPIAMERGGQILFRLKAQQLEAPARNVHLRPGEVTELTPIMEFDRLMIQEELGFNPFERDPKIYRDGWLKRIRELRVWLVGPQQGPYEFKVEQSAISDDVIQLSGVYTAVACRRQGIARAAISQICKIVLSDTPMVSLYVHKENIAAVNLYRSLGFEALGHVRSVWFDI